jgi:Ca-activated chloride channel homolog
MRAASFRSDEGEDLILEGVKAQGRVTGRMLDMTLEQRFRNPAAENVEVVYTFPLPWRAVLLGLEVELNGETLKGLVKAREQARADYEEALSEGHSGILVTVNPDRTAYTLELGNLMGGESCVVRLQYVQVLQPEQGSLRLTLPTTIAPRYGHAVRDGGFEPQAAPQVSATAEYPFEIALDIVGELVQAEIGSPSHRIALQTLPDANSKTGHQPGRMTRVRLAAQAWLDRDFVLVFNQLPHASMGLAAWDRFDTGLGVVMASFTPRLPTRQSLPVTMKVLVDCSGSMAGDSIQAARSALHGILSSLQPQDRFSLSRFGSTVEHRSRALWRAAPPALASAQRWAQQLDANLGGTAMNEAILSTLALPGADRSDILLVTDGEIEAIDEVLESARQSAHRFFVVGIGASAAEGLLRRLAEETGGSCEFVAPGEGVQPVIERLYQRMRSPAVMQARIEWMEGSVIHAASDLPGSIFDGDDVVVFARLHAVQAESLQGSVRLYGRIDGVEGEVCLAEVRPEFIADEANTLARLAAHQRYWQLLQGGERIPAVLRKQLPALAEQYQLVTDKTSLILVKQRAEGEQALDMPELRIVAGMLAAGWGGQGAVMASQVPSVVDSVRFSRRADAASPSWDSVQPTIARQLQSRAAPRFRHPAHNDKLRAFIDSMDEVPRFLRRQVESAEEVHAPKAPERTAEFWAAGNQAGHAGSNLASWTAFEGLTPAGFVEWLGLNPDFTPDSYASLRETGLPAAVVEWLEFVVGAGQPEAEVVEAFVQAMAGRNFKQGLRRWLGAGTNPSGQPAVDGRSSARIEVALAGVAARQWPAGVLDFAQA